MSYISPPLKAATYSAPDKDCPAQLKNINNAC